MTLNPNELAVETFATGTPDASLTTEPAAGPKTMEPGCTAFVELCPTQTTVGVVA